MSTEKTLIFLFLSFIIFFFSFGNRYKTKLIAMGENSSLTRDLTATGDRRFGHKLWKYREGRFSQPSDVKLK